MKVPVFLLFLTGLLHAGTALSFDSELVSVDAAASATEVTADFTFTNRTDKTIRITKMDAPCSCLSARLVPASLLANGIAPGESGTVRGHFEIGAFKGSITKAIALWTDEGSADPSVFLEAEVNIPVLFDVQPKTVEWQTGSQPEPKTLTITVNHTEPISILSHRITNDSFSYTISEVKPGWEYTIVVTPKNTESPGIGILSIETDCEIAKHARQQAFMVVRKPKPNGE